MHQPNIIDVEASGFGGESYPIEVGLALSNGSRFCTLILPMEGWVHWDKEAERIHKIPRETLSAYGKPVNEVAALLNKMLEGMTVYSDGWVVDKPWLTTLFHASGLQMKFSVSSLEMILSEIQMHVWHETKDDLIFHERIDRHRASNDAWIVQETFRRTNLIAKRGRECVGTNDT